MHLPVELKQAIEAAHGGPIEITDGDEHYVLGRAEVFERVKELLDPQPLPAEHRRGLLRRAALRVGWDDPQMDTYNELDPR